jgi:hypothetical protein
MSAYKTTLSHKPKILDRVEFIIAVLYFRDISTFFMTKERKTKSEFQ